VYLDFADAIKRNGKKWIEEKYGNLFDMYHEITAEDPYKTPCEFTRGSLHHGRTVVDYNLMSTIPGLYSSARRTSPTMEQTAWAPAR